MGPKKGAAPPPPPPEENYLKANNNILLIKESTMDADMQQKAIDATKEGLEKFNIEREVATYIKQYFENAYGPYWQCVVGRNFGSYVSFETHYIYFYLGKVGVLLYKNGEES
jgi:Dynein light chain type 1.